MVGEMSNLKRDIEELLKEVRKWRYEAPGQSVDINTLIKAERKMYKQATTQIINLIESVLPKTKEEYNQTIDDDGFDYEANERNMGYNQAIKDIKSKLIEERDKE